MSLTFTRAIRVPAVNGTLTDADSTPTIKVVRTDTGATVVAAGTAMTHDSTGRYSYTLSGEAAGVTYRATTTIVVGGQTATSDSDITAGGAAASGTYAAQQDVQDLIDAANLVAVGDLDADGALDTGIVQRDLDASTVYINLELLRNGLAAPADLSNATHAATLRTVSAHLTVWELWKHRGLQEATGRRDDIAGYFQGFKTYADEQLAKLIEVLVDAGGTGTEIIPAMQAVVPASERCGWPNGWY